MGGAKGRARRGEELARGGHWRTHICTSLLSDIELILDL